MSKVKYFFKKTAVQRNRILKKHPEHVVHIIPTDINQYTMILIRRDFT